MVKIKKFIFMDDYLIHIIFQDGKEIIYDLKEDFNLPGYSILKDEHLYRSGELSESKCFLRWNDQIDLPSDILYEYGKQI